MPGGNIGGGRGVGGGEGVGRDLTGKGVGEGQDWIESRADTLAIIRRQTTVPRLGCFLIPAEKSRRGLNTASLSL